MIKDEKPYSCEYNIPWHTHKVDDALITDLSEKEQEAAEIWIKSCVYPSSTKNNHTSYGIKHMLEEVTNCYVSNNQGKDLFLKHGYRPIDPDELNWEYKVKIIDGHTKIPLKKANFPVKKFNINTNTLEDYNLFQSHRVLRSIAIWKTRPNVRSFFMTHDPLRYWFGDTWGRIEWEWDQAPDGTAYPPLTTKYPKVCTYDECVVPYRKILTDLVDSISVNSCRQFLKEDRARK